MHLGKVFKNAGILAGGDSIAAALGLLSFAILARTLGVDDLGLFTVILAYVTIIDRFVNFQSWQALIKYGEKVKKDRADFDSLLSFGIFIDLITALFGFGFSVALCVLIAPFFDWNHVVIDLIQVYSLVILVNIEGTPTAIYRIRNRFKYFSIKAIIIASLRLFLYLCGWIYSCGIDYFIYSTLVSQIIGYAYFAIQSLKYSSLRPFKYFNVMNIKIALGKNPGFLSFICLSNIQTSMKLTTSLVDVLLVSKYVGNNAVGLLQVAKQFSKIFRQVSSPLYKSIYPELTSLWNLKKFKEFKSLIRNSIKIVTIFSVTSYFLFVLFGEFAIVTLMGPEFVRSYDLMLIYFVGVLIFSSTFPFSPAFLAMNLPKIPLMVTFSSSLTFIAIFALTYREFGYLSIGISFTAMTVVWVLQNVLIFRMKVRNL